MRNKLLKYSLHQLLIGEWCLIQGKKYSKQIYQQIYCNHIIDYEQQPFRRLLKGGTIIEGYFNMYVIYLETGPFFHPLHIKHNAFI